MSKIIIIIIIIIIIRIMTIIIERDNCDWCFWYSHQRIIKGT